MTTHSDIIMHPQNLPTLLMGSGWVRKPIHLHKIFNSPIHRIATWAFTY